MDNPGGPHVSRLLRVADGCRAELTLAPAGAEVARVEIRDASTGVRHDVQLSFPGYIARRGDRCVATFVARADRPRPIGVGFARNHEPWDNLGGYHVRHLDESWQPYACEFDVSDDDTEARVHLDLGEVAIGVEVSGLELRSLSDGTLLRRPATGSGRTVAPERGGPTPEGGVTFGALRRVTPINRDFGYRQGTPIDRHYIEAFLARQGADIQGNVLEIGDPGYTRRFGGTQVSRSDVLHVQPGNPHATIVADLADAPGIASNQFDCIILTQTLQLIYDVHAAIRTAHRILRPGGVVLATFPGISQTYDTEWGRSWCWSFTPISAGKLFGDVFGRHHVTIGSHGNVLTAVAFLHGLSREELTAAELDYREEGYPLTITVRAQKDLALA